MDKRTKNIIKDLAEFHGGGNYIKGDLEELLEAFVEAQDCEHECTSNCRREGCNCDCGEWHITDLD